MKRLRSIFFLVLCFLLGVGAALTYHRLRKVEVTAPAIGIGNAPPLRGFSLSTPVSTALLDSFPPMHATATAIRYPGDRKTLGAVVAHIHKLRMKAVLLPPAEFSATDPYPRALAEIAADATAAGVDVVCISWLNVDPDADYWQAQIAGMRKVFTGRLILAATPDLLPGIEFWDQVDLVGAIGPFDLPLRSGAHSRSVELADVRTAWACYLDSLESLAFRYGKKLVLLNVSVAQGGSQGVAAEFDPLVYEAVVTETKGRSGTEGLFMNWTASPRGAAQGIHQS